MKRMNESQQASEGSIAARMILRDNLSSNALNVLNIVISLNKSYHISIINVI